MIRTVNLEAGMPTADLAIRRATYALKQARHDKVKAIKFIHGYGSSGTGGRIRTELQQYLTRLCSRGEIRLFVPGDRFEIFDRDTQQLLSLCRDFSKDSDLNRHNNGITVVLL